MPRKRNKRKVRQAAKVAQQSKASRPAIAQVAQIHATGPMMALLAGALLSRIGTQATDVRDKPKRCPVCHGRGSIRCDCWPADCICGGDDEPCDECDGTGWIDPDRDYWDEGAP